MNKQVRNLSSGFLRSCNFFPELSALEIRGTRLSYRQLYDKAASLSATLQLRAETPHSNLTAVFAYRYETAFSGILAALFSGDGYQFKVDAHSLTRFPRSSKWG